MAEQRFTTLTPVNAIKDFYDKNGYVVINNLFEFNEIDKIYPHLDELISKNPDNLDYSIDEKSGGRVLAQLRHPTFLSEVLKNILLDNRVKRILSYLLGENIRLDGSKLNFKPAQVGAPVEWHQDWAYLPHTNDSLLTVGIFIDNCNKKNAPLMVVPQSHKGPIMNHHHKGEFMGIIAGADIAPFKDKITSLTGLRGSVSFHHYRILHGSSYNRSLNSRRILYGRFSTADAWPLHGLSDFFSGFTLETLTSRIVSGEQTLLPRLEKVPLLIPHPLPGDETIFQTQEKALDRYFS